MSLAFQLESREFVPELITHCTVLVPMAESSLGGSEHCGHGAFNLVAILSEIGLGQVKEFAGVTDFANASLVYVRGSKPGQQPDSIDALRQIPLYFEEVRPFKQIGPDNMHKRLLFARLTGFLLIGPDECMAILRQREGMEYTFCDVYENNEVGGLRSLSGYYATNLEHAATHKRIEDLDKTATDDALATARGDILWWMQPSMGLSSEQAKRMTLTVELLKAHLNVAPLERLESGAACKRWFISDGSTNSVSALTRNCDGWVHYPTAIDAWYFGIWINPAKRETLTYAEQDVIHVLCDNQAQFIAELASMAARYGTDRSPSGYAIGQDGTSANYDSLTLLRGDVKTFVFGNTCIETDSHGKLVAPVIGHLKIDHPSVQAMQDGDRIALNRDLFELDLLNPLAFTLGIQASLTKAFGSLQLQVKSAAAKELIATLS